MKAYPSWARAAARHAAVLCMAATAFASGAARAAGPAGTYPDHPVRLIVTYSPGGAFDFIGRLLAKGLQDLWGQAVVVENRPGASGAIGADLVARAKPDGLTLLIGSAGPVVVVPFLRDSLPYDPLKDLQPVAMTAIIPNVLVVGAKSRYHTFKELLDDARARPGQIDYASSGRGDSHQMSMEHMMRATGVRLNEIPYKGGAPAVVAVSSGEVSAAWLAVSTALPLIQTGQVRPLAVSTNVRVPDLPGVPTVAESGYPGFEVIYWIGVMGPANMPPAVLRKLQADLRKVYDTREYRDNIEKTGNMMRFGDAEEYGRVIRADYARNKQLLAP
ncbi:tripartite tricarboxylate transporter substrate binding protein [Pigmentiphaga soli]|uniref:Tripartite tricarboxylate transporter substrate binding protein n=1 Tax=Pigmentiphaga soli TaxID=1007095 RepID=A0ABP8HAY8_9BURK